MAKKIDVNGLDHYHDKVSAMLASEYSSSKTYAVGDYCFHAGTLYECTTAITTAEAWTSGHWTAAKLAEDTSALKTAIFENQFGTYKIVNSSDIERGSYSNSGKLSSSRTLRTSTPIKVHKGDVVSFSVGGLYYLTALLNSNSTDGGNVIAETSYTSSSKNFVVPSDGYLMLMFANGASYGESTTIYVADFLSTYYVTIDYLGRITTRLDADEKQIETLDTSVGLIAKSAIEQGAWNTTNQKVSDSKRIRVKDRIKVNLGDSLIIHSNLYYYISEYANATEGTPETFNTGWFKVDDAYAYVAKSNGYLCVSIANAGTYGASTSITPSDFDGTLNVQIDTLNVPRIKNILGETGVDFVELPNYWQAYMATKLPTIQGHEEVCGENGDSFIFLTDYHYSGVDGGTSGNCGYSNILVKNIIANTNIKMFVNGGDNINGNASKDVATEQMRVVSRRFNGIDMYGIRGNHDFNLDDGGSASVMLSDSLFYTLFIKDVEDKITANGLDYYHDNEQQKIRYIFMDTRYDSQTDAAGLITDAQITWMKARITELDSGWNVIVFAHQYFAPISEQPEEPSPSDPPVYRTGAVKIKNALVELYGTVNADIVAVISGHLHADFSYTGNGFLEVATTTDSSQALDDGFERGTTNEQAFDVFSLDLESKTLTADRVGRGNSRQWTYT